MVVVVTGAGSGIGRAIARSYAKRGADLVLADINEESLLDAKREFESPGIRVYAQVTDVTMADDIASLCENSYRIMGRCDVLVNNAGVAMFGLVEQTSLSDWKWLLDVNLWGVIYGCHYFYPRMIEQGGGGHIVNVSSAAGLGPIPAQVVYCASKYAVVGLSETLRGEGALNGIGVSVICPSLVNTNIPQSVRWRMTTKNCPTEELFIQKSAALATRRNYSADNVGERVVRAVERNKGIVKVGPEAYLMDYAHRLFPSIGRVWQIMALKVMNRTL
jgi:NADP-dependent 3-hydroxy acid dehydrogenase YdfG